MARACAAGGKTAASSRSQLRSDGSSGPARHTSASSAPTVGSSLPRRYQAHARRRGRRPQHRRCGASAARGVLARIGGEQRGQSLGERNEIRGHQPLADAVPARGEDQLQLGRSRSPRPVGEHALPRDLTRYARRSSPSSTPLYDTGSPAPARRELRRRRSRP